MNPAMLLLADGRFPTGGHAHSAGVEQAVSVGDIVDRVTLECYLRGRLDTTGRVDAAFAAHTCAIGSNDDMTDQRCCGEGSADSARRLLTKVDAVDVEYSARIVSPYLRTVSSRLGRQILRAARSVWDHPVLDACGEVHQPIAFGALVAAAGGTPHDAALLTLHHLGAAVTSSAVRLLALDPFHATAVQRAVFSDCSDIAAHAETWATQRPADLPARGGTLTEILGEMHGAQSARLFVA